MNSSPFAVVGPNPNGTSIGMYGLGLGPIRRLRRTARCGHRGRHRRARASPDGIGVVASSTSGTALQAETDSAGAGIDSTSARGYRVSARGGRAPLRLVPSARTGKPTTGNHALGEVYVDKAGALWLCTVAGTPGNWRKVALV